VDAQSKFSRWWQWWLRDIGSPPSRAKPSRAEELAFRYPTGEPGFAASVESVFPVAGPTQPPQSMSPPVLARWKRPILALDLGLRQQR
jgi:hypothetical protein